MSRARSVALAFGSLVLLALLGAVLQEARAQARGVIEVPGAPLVPGQTLHAGAPAVPLLQVPASLSMVGSSATWQAFPGYTGEVYAAVCARTGSIVSGSVSMRLPPAPFTSYTGPWSITPGPYVEFKVTVRISGGASPGTATVCFRQSASGPVIASTVVTR